MRSSSKGRFGVVVVVLLVIGAVGWWAWNKGSLPAVPTGIVDVAKSTQKPTTGGVASGDGSTESATGSTETAPDKEKPEVAVETEAPAEPVAPKTWEDHLDDILLSDDNENSKADQILALMPTTPLENQEELTQHLVNMVQDDHYTGASNLLMNVNTDTNVADILLNDLLNRNNTLKLNTLLQLVKTPDHPLHENAREMLELFVQEDHGTNYQDWEKAVGDWLKENEPDPQAQQAQAAAPDAPAPQ